MKIVKLDITDDNLLSGVDAVALVENPAHEEDFMYFKSVRFIEEENPQGVGTSRGDASNTRSAEVSKTAEEILQKKSDDFNEKYKEELGYGTTVGMLKAVYQRGRGAYNTSHRATVNSPEQWAQARVNAFLYLVEKGRPENDKYIQDNDLLPAKHPKSDENNQMQFQSYNDYPESAVNAAKRALEYRDNNPDNDCGTPVGWARANQLSRRVNISRETIARMASFARHLQYEDVPYSEGCGGLMVDAWGGRAGIEWASSKLEELKNEFADTVPGVNLGNVDAFVKAIVQGYFQSYYFNPELFYGNSGLNVSGLTDWLNEFPDDEPLYEYPWYVYSIEGNLDILGYQTKAFDMCPGAIAHFTHLLTMDLDEDTKGMVRSGAVVADMVFLVEKQIEEHGIANNDQLVEAISLVDDFTDIMQEVDKAVGMEHSVDYMQSHIDYIASMVPIAFQEECPPSTLDVVLNLKNRQTAIEVANYGPLNPNEPNEGYWQAKAAQFGGDIESAKKALCGNCAAFIQTTKMLDCISTGLGTEVDIEQTIEAGDLGYCQIFKFKCASRRTCDAWIGGGPIVDAPTPTDQLIEIATSIVQLSKIEALVSGKEKKKLPANPISRSPQAFARQHLAKEKKVIGPLMIPNKLIMRVDEEGQPYYVYFTEDTVKRIADKFMKEDRLKSFNLEHNQDKKLKKVYFTESWLVTDSEKDKSNAYGFTPRKGTWMGTVKFDNDYVWNNYVREGKVLGFSVEGFFVDKLFNQGTQEKFVEPRLGEGETEYISRCMGSDIMLGEFPDVSQRAAVCYTTYANK